MSNRNDRSDAALHERLEIAEKATQGPWYHTLAAIVGTKKSPEDNDATCICFTEWGCSGDPQANAAHIAASSPDVVRADIEEILRLRAEVERLNKVSHYLAERLSPLNVTRRKYIGATLEDGYGNALFLTREEAIRSWLDEANREVSNAE